MKMWKKTETGDDGRAQKVYKRRLQVIISMKTVSI